MIKRLPIHEGMVRSDDRLDTVEYGPLMFDCYVDETGIIHRRPGLSDFCDLGTDASVDGLFWWPSQQWAIAISGGKTFKITDKFGTKTEITNDTFELNTRATFADFGDQLFAANGGKILRMTPTVNPTELTDADAPTQVTHVGFLDRYLIANNSGTGEFHWSDVNAPTVWTGNYAEAEAVPDDLTALIVKNLRINLIGTHSLEFWYNDGVTPFAREPQGYVSRGTVAPYSFTFCNYIDSFLWIDERRSVVAVGGVTPLTISPPIASHLNSFENIQGAMGDYIEEDGRPYWVCHVPVEDKTLVYDFLSKKWYFWGYWKKGSYKRWRGNCHAHSPEWNINLVGDHSNGMIYKLDRESFQDSGDVVRTLVRTDHYDHGSQSSLKFSNALYIRLKRVRTAGSSSSPKLVMRYRDNGETAWGNYIEIDLSPTGAIEYRGQITRLGSYYSRQYEFFITDDSSLAIVSVEEDFDIEG